MMDFVKLNFNSYFLNNLFIIFPEVFIGITILVLLFFFVYFKSFYGNFKYYTNFLDNFSYSLGLFAIFVYILLCFLQLFFEVSSFFNNFYYSFESLLKIDVQILFAKFLCGISIFIIFQLYFQNKKNRIKVSSSFGFEKTIFFLNLLLGMSLCLESNSLIIFYVALELQSFCFFILLAINLNEIDSIKSCIIYFLTIVFSSIIFLLGLSYLYWRFGSLSIETLSLLVYMSNYSGDFNFIDIFFSLVLIIGLLAKVGLFPVHFWVPRVYSTGSILPVSLIATTSKIFGFFILFKFFIIFNSNLTIFVFIEFFSILAILVGVLGALAQVNFRSLIGYSAISQIGYIFAIFSINSTDAYVFSLFYLITYMINVFPVFLFLLFVYWSPCSKEYENNFKFLSDFENIKLNNWIQVTVFLGFTTFFFSFIGIPPFPGFFAKFFIIKYLILTSHFFTAFIVGISSIISAAYYLKVIRHLFFGSRKTFKDAGWELPWTVSFFVIIFGLINIGFIFIVSQLLIFLFSIIMLRENLNKFFGLAIV